MPLDRLKEVVLSGLSAGREARSCSVPHGVDSHQRSFSQALLLSIGLLAAGSGCRNAEVETQMAWDGSSDARCFSDYNVAYPEEDPDFVSFGAMTDDYHDNWPAEAYPLGYIDPYGAKVSESRVFLKMGNEVNGGTEVAIAGHFLGFNVADNDSIFNYPVDYSAFCDDPERSFIVSIYHPNPTGNSDLQIVGRTIRPMKKTGEAITLFNSYTFFYDNLLPPEEVPGGETEEEVVGDTMDVEVEETASIKDLIPPVGQIVEVRVGQMKNEGSMTLSQMWDALGSGQYADVTLFKTY
ncbi:MAG: hypothetical protein WC882_02090 [Candidatus Gracilibacteria bacterium]